MQVLEHIYSVQNKLDNLNNLFIGNIFNGVEFQCYSIMSAIHTKNYLHKFEDRDTIKKVLHLYINNKIQLINKKSIYDRFLEYANENLYVIKPGLDKDTNNLVYIFFFNIEKFFNNENIKCNIVGDFYLFIHDDEILCCIESKEVEENKNNILKIIIQYKYKKEKETEINVLDYQLKPLETKPSFTQDNNQNFILMNKCNNDFEFVDGKIKIIEKKNYGMK